MKRHRTLPAATLAAALLISLTACSTKGTDRSTDADGATRTGPGVSATTITLGVLTDLSGPGAPLGKASLQAQQLYFDRVNAAGGVCGRKVELLVRDHGYDVQKAVAGYTEIQPRIAAVAQLLGSPQTTALLDSVERDGLLTLVGGNSASLLGHPHVRLVATTYGVEMVNGVDFLVGRAALAAGDKVGLVYQEGDYGADAAAGARFAARKAGLTLVEQTVKATDTDMTAQVTALRAAGVKAVLFSGTPGQTASLVGVATATGLRVPVLASSPAFVAQLLDTPVKAALEQSLYVSSSLPPLGSDAPAVTGLLADYRAKYPTEPLNQAVEVGAVDGKLMTDALTAACKAGDLSRNGITAALNGLHAFDNGFGTVQDYSRTDQPPSLKTYVLQPADGVPGGLKTVRDAAEAPAVAEFLAATKN
ncbi:ABC transporter substrate-binding protein [Kitasatospora phosalacinea]|uniref:ABC transporter substrate-binding protein n=1 Tax=Kitasatospora phosalacinea TaxID=2065 RepID=A0ABW6GW04_9ACTN